MKVFAVAAVFLLTGIMPMAQADQCNGWISQEYPVTMESCSYEDGSSGYVKVTNNGGTEANVCWIVSFNNGDTDRGCYTHMSAGEVTTPSCFSCGYDNVGVSSIDLEHYIPAESAGSESELSSSEDDSDSEAGSAEDNSMYGLSPAEAYEAPSEY